jgi:hypothetical protein
MFMLRAWLGPGAGVAVHLNVGILVQSNDDPDVRLDVLH